MTYRLKIYTPRTTVSYINKCLLGFPGCSLDWPVNMMKVFVSIENRPRKYINHLSQNIFFAMKIRFLVPIYGE